MVENSLCKKWHQTSRTDISVKEPISILSPQKFFEFYLCPTFLFCQWLLSHFLFRRAHVQQKYVGPISELNPWIRNTEKSQYDVRSVVLSIFWPVDHLSKKYPMDHFTMQAHRQGFAEGGPEISGKHIFNAILDVCSNRGPTWKWRHRL